MRQPRFCRIGGQIMRICVYGASSSVIDRAFILDGEKLGREMAKRNIGLVFGAGANGLMGAAARGVAEVGGEIIGVAPKFFNVDGMIFDGCTELIRTETMRERKQIMEDKADAFIMTPGGIGTYEEFFEILTLKQLGRHNKPIAVLNTNGFYDDLLRFLDNAVEKEFMKADCKKLYRVFTDVSEMLDYIENYKDEPLDIMHFKNI